MPMKTLAVLLFSAILTFLSGCAVSFEESISASDLTIDELENRMSKAMDPDGRFARAATYVMRQQITTENGWLEPLLVQMVEVKFRRPDQFKLTTYTDNQPETAIIASGNQGWMVDYKREKIVVLEKNALKRVLVMVRLTNPGSRVRTVFENVSIDRSTIDEEVFYRLTCSNGSNAPMYIYVDSKAYLNKRLRMTTTVNGYRLRYDSRMLNYGMYEGVLIPDESIIRQDGSEQKSKVIDYKLDIKLEDSEFRPPLF